jgi:hypothetical protein
MMTMTMLTTTRSDLDRFDVIVPEDPEIITYVNKYNAGVVQPLANVSIASC